MQSALQIAPDTVYVLQAIDPTFLDYAPVVGVGLVVLQLVVLIVGQSRDHSRRKKQATIEFTKGAEEMFTVAHRELKEALTEEILAKDKAKEIVANRSDPLRAKIVGFLNRLEHLATGVNHGVFDRGVVKDLAGSFLVGIYLRYQHFIAAAEDENKLVFRQFRKLVTKLARKYPETVPERLRQLTGTSGWLK